MNVINLYPLQHLYQRDCRGLFLQRCVCWSFGKSLNFYCLLYYCFICNILHNNFNLVCYTVTSPLTWIQNLLFWCQVFEGTLERVQFIFWLKVDYWFWHNVDFVSTSSTFAEDFWADGGYYYCGCKVSNPREMRQKGFIILSSASKYWFSKCSAISNYSELSYLVFLVLNLEYICVLKYWNTGNKLILNDFCRLHIFIRLLTL